MTTTSWLPAIKEDLGAVVAVITGMSRSEVVDTYKTKARTENPSLVLFTSYMIGRDAQDTEIMNNARRVLSVAVPGIEQRLPWYEAMADIMEKGKYEDLTSERGLGPMRFELDVETHRAIAQRLAEGARISSEDAAWAVSRLSSHMGLYPGHSYTTQMAMVDRDVRREVQIFYLCQSLFRQWGSGESRMWDTIADAHYDTIQESLRPIPKVPTNQTA